MMCLISFEDNKHYKKMKIHVVIHIICLVLHVEALFNH